MPVGSCAGVFGRALHLDCSTGEHAWIELGPSLVRRYLGGVGLGTRLLCGVAPATLDPLDAGAPVVFAFSPLVGTPLTTSAKLAVVARSPLTGRISDALSSSHFAISGKRAGMDALVITGACSELSVLLVDNGVPRLERAPELAGLSPSEAAEAVRARWGADWRVASIGVAGERLVRYATVSNDGRHAGRGGLGAVLGSKRLKCIAVRGNQRVPLADQELVLELARDLSARSMGAATAKYREVGTVANLLVFNRLAVLPTRNFQSGSFEAAAALSAEQMAPLREKARESCAACTIGCEHVYGFGTGSDRPAGATRIEYESLFALGPLLGVSDPDLVLAAAARCDELGIDTISAGGTLAFAMEARERGLLQLAPADPGLAFGDGRSVLVALDAIAQRRGIGDLLAEGSRRAAAVIGQDSERFACHVKGLELPGYEPRGLQAMALGLAVSTRGADHNRSGAYEADFSGRVDRFHGSAAHAIEAAASEDRAALIDSLILCKFLRGVFGDLFEESAGLLRAITGWDCDGTELLATARRIVCARKLFNVRAGWTRAEDTLPPRILREAIPGPPEQAGGAPGAPAALPADRLDAMIAAYYAERGWNQDGSVPDAVVAAHQLDDLFQAPATIDAR